MGTSISQDVVRVHRSPATFANSPAHITCQWRCRLHNSEGEACYKKMPCKVHFGRVISASVPGTHSEEIAPDAVGRFAACLISYSDQKQVPSTSAHTTLGREAHHSLKEVRMFQQDTSRSREKQCRGAPRTCSCTCSRVAPIS